MKVLVTGGAGFIGSNLVQYFCDLGHDVVAMDDFSSSGRRRIDPRAELFEGSVDNSNLLEELMDGRDVVFHLAATGVVKISLENPELYFRNNFMNGLKVLEAMKKKGVKKIIYSSTAAVYGETKTVAVKEDDSKEPVSPYGAAKFAFESALSAYYHAFGISSVSLRYFNVYGPGDEQRPVTRAVPSWIKAALNNEPITLFWGGRQKKDYIFVGDVVRANLLAAERCRGFNVYNVGSGEGVLILDLAKKLERVFGKKLAIKEMGDRPGDPNILIADIGKIRKELGWEPKVGLEEGLKRTIKYYAGRIQK